MTETRKAIATRGMIARVALRLAQERGPAQVTAQDIADHARVSVRTARAGSPQSPEESCRDNTAKPGSHPT